MPQVTAAEQEALERRTRLTGTYDLHPQHRRSGKPPGTLEVPDETVKKPKRKRGRNPFDQEPAPVAAAEAQGPPAPQTAPAPDMAKAFTKKPPAASAGGSGGVPEHLVRMISPAGSVSDAYQKDPDGSGAIWVPHAAVTEMEAHGFVIAHRA